MPEKEHVTAVSYSGHETLTFTGYLDLATERTLTCVPGGTYDIAPVSISDPAVPGTGHFTLVEDESLPEEEFVPGEPEEETPEEGEER